MIPALHPRLRALARHPGDRAEAPQRLRRFWGGVPTSGSMLSRTGRATSHAGWGRPNRAVKIAADSALTPASRVRLVGVTFSPQDAPGPGLEDFAAVVRERPDTWPGGARAARPEPACLLAGPLHTPGREGQHGRARTRQFPLARVLFGAWDAGQRDVPGDVVEAVLARHLGGPRE